MTYLEENKTLVITLVITSVISIITVGILVNLRNIHVLAEYINEDKSQCSIECWLSIMHKLFVDFFILENRRIRVFPMKWLSLRS